MLAEGEALSGSWSPDGGKFVSLKKTNDDFPIHVQLEVLDLDKVAALSDCAGARAWESLSHSWDAETPVATTYGRTGEAPSVTPGLKHWHGQRSRRTARASPDSGSGVRRQCVSSPTPANHSERGCLACEAGPVRDRDERRNERSAVSAGDRRQVRAARR